MLQTDFDISRLTSFKIGGKVKKVFCPESVDEFVEILENEPEAKVFGSLSNTLVSSDGYDGAVILTANLCDVRVEGTKISAECGIKGPMLAQIAAENGLSGFEFMTGFPGSLGGNICMNASANGQSISGKLISVKCYDGKSVKSLLKKEMCFSYRHSLCCERDLTVLSAEFELEQADRAIIEDKMRENLAFRKAHQPSLALPNCGSVFKNPENASAGALLDNVGAKTMSQGGVRVWENHANFIINENNGSSKDVLRLMERMSTAVQDKYGVILVPEVRYLGNNEEEVKLCEKLQIK